MSQDGGWAGGLFPTRVTRQRLWYMNTIRVGGRRLGLESLATEGAGVVVGVWPDQQQSGQDTQQRMDFLRLSTALHSCQNILSEKEQWTFLWRQEVLLSLKDKLSRVVANYLVIEV